MAFCNVPTVKVKADNGQGFMVINASDFDDKVHTKFVEGSASKPKAKKTAKKSTKKA